jgi:hypothetical protein
MTTRSSSLPPPQPGEVIRYAYLWTNERDAGREEGAKDRPAAVVLTAMDRDGRPTVYVVPITSRAPDQPDHAVLVPPDVRRRLGLQDEPCWVVVTELNRFAWPGPDLRPVSPPGSGFSHGFLPRVLFVAVRDAVVANIRTHPRSMVSRTE